MDKKPTADSTLADSQQWLQERLEKGQTCPCCKQFAKIYKRPINGVSAYSLIRLYWECHYTDDYVHIAKITPPHMAGGGDFAKLVYWDLVEEMPKGEGVTEKRTSGFWKITEKGRQFVDGEITVPSHVRLYDGKSLGLVGGQVGIKEVLGNKFDYAELMGMVA